MNQNSLKTFGYFYLKMKTIFMNTENSNKMSLTNFFYQFTEKLNLKNSNKNIPLAN